MLDPIQPRRFSPPRPSAASRGYGGRWRKIRLAVLRNEPKCRRCDEPATEVDHVDGDVGNCDLDNLQPLCGRCHRLKTQKEQGALQW